MKKKKRLKANGLQTLCNTDDYNCRKQFLILIDLIIMQSALNSNTLAPRIAIRDILCYTDTN